jgi:hypothetical protein
MSLPKSKVREFKGDIFEIRDYLYISDYWSSLDISNISKRNISLVINISDIKYKDEHIRNLTEKDISFTEFKIEDNESKNIINIAKQIHKLIEKTRSHDKDNLNPHNILIHSNASLSRSPSIAIFHLIKGWRMKYIEAYTYVNNIIPDLDINDGFKKQLKDYETSQH